MSTNIPAPSSETPQELTKGLQARHMTMIAVGGVIGAGFFLGVGGAIQKAGPAVLIAYLAGGILAWRDEVDPSLPRY